jgi:hypothetical protein
MDRENRYKLSFTAIGLGLSESIKIAEVYHQCRNWETTKEIIDQDNTLQSRTNRRTIRIVRELIHRLSKLTPTQFDLLLEGTLKEQRLLLWFAVCNYYEIVRDFALEVLHEKYLVMDMNLSEKDYHAFILRKLDWHPELNEITKSTQEKIRTVLFRMLHEADLLDDEGYIQRVVPSSNLSNALRTHAHFAHRIYPAFPDEFGG